MVANVAAATLLDRQPTLLLANERPDFIALDVPQGEAPQFGAEEVVALVAELDQQPHDGFLVDPRKAEGRK